MRDWTRRGRDLLYRRSHGHECLYFTQEIRGNIECSSHKLDKITWDDSSGLGSLPSRDLLRALCQRAVDSRYFSSGWCLYMIGACRDLFA